MFAVLFHAGDKLQQLALFKALSGYDLNKLWLAFSESAGLVDNDDIDLLQGFQGLGIFDEDTFSGAAADAYHDGHGSGEAQCARTGDDKNGDRVHETVCETRLRTEHRPAEKGESSNRDDGRDEIAGDFIGQALNGGAAALRACHHGHDLWQKCHVADSLGSPE